MFVVDMYSRHELSITVFQRKLLCWVPFAFLLSQSHFRGYSVERQNTIFESEISQNFLS